MRFCSLIVVLMGLAFTAFTNATTNPQQPTITLTLAVTDKDGRYVGGLRKDQVAVLDQDRPQEIVSFQQVDVPVSIGFVFENSFLKMGDVAKASQAALVKFLADGHAQNEYSVIGFGDRVQPEAELTKDRKQVAGALPALAKSKQSQKIVLYDAVETAIKSLERGANSKRAIILISDDKDDGSLLKHSELLETLKRREILFYAIRLKPGRSDTLEELTSVTGGKTFYPKGSAAFADILEIISLELRHQYSLEYKTQPSSAGNWHDLKFTVQSLRMKDGKEVALFPRGRAGYYGH